MAIRDEVYRKLSEAKSEDESFSEVIERLLGRKASLLPLWGSLSTSKALAGLEAETGEIRKGAILRD